MRFLRQSLTGLFLICLTVAILAMAAQMVRSAFEERWSREARSPVNRERVFAVNVVAATPQTITPVLTAFGEVQSRRTLDIRASAGGRVIDLAQGFVEGGRVEGGDLLVQIDPANAQSALDRVKSDLLDAEAEAREAERALALARDELEAAREQADLRDRAFQRQVDLRERGVGTAAAVEAAELAASSAKQAVLSRRQALAQGEARIDQAATRLARTRIALGEAERKLADTRITARFSGTLSGVNLVEGGLVSVNERLAQLIDPQTLEVAFRVSTSQYARLLDEDGTLKQADATVKLDVFGTELTAQARISRDSAAVGEGQTGRLIFAALQQSAGFKPGDFVTIEVQEPALTNVVRLPSSAVSANQKVLVLGQDDRLEEADVRLLRRQRDDVLVRAAGLNGQRIVAERTPLLGAGIKVRALSSAGAKTPEAPEMVELSDERRAKLVAFVEANTRIPDEAKSRILSRLSQDKVPARMVKRLEARMGG